MATREQPSFRQMCRATPFRTALFTFGPLLVGAAQVTNAFVHGSHLPLLAAVVAVTVLYSALVTRYQLATFRRRAVTRTLE
ncbi:hypothetical protein C475_21569 [Halosimplex carlsbadense 2-9-1]|uniref:Uncharacterized protein n=1 Tax=Halosimplex carlsbadense 2-9-1 TaxID=797114 RepID=M0C9L6_9EURY|nr:hypothetical protein [Halosimplex carlsbadense]ELZ19930.1 hypothetical protein C475_21569 [Halosimplex carlsbadense 2-9-1]